MDAQEIVVFVTIGSLQDGAKIGRELIEKKLGACVNLLPHMTSIFCWDGKVTEEEECLMIIKTRKENYQNLEEAVRSLHPYEVPEIIALPITQGFPGYLAWVKESTQTNEES